jgi:hypothetical protein
MKSKFILCGLVNGSDKISGFRLVHNVRKYSSGQCVRVNIPEDLILQTYPGDGYSITSDNRTLDNLGWDCYVVFKGKWRRFNWLKQLYPYEWSEALEYIFGLYNCFDDIGLTDDPEYYKAWWNRHISEVKDNHEIVYPKFDKNAKDLNIQPNLKTYPFKGNQEKWYKIYQELKKKK